MSHLITALSKPVLHERLLSLARVYHRHPHGPPMALGMLFTLYILPALTL